MSKVAHQEQIAEFLEIYREHTCLWQVKSKDYSNKQKRSFAYQQLLDKLKEIDSTATISAVVKKINLLRTNFKREFRKVQNACTSGKGADEVYKPNLWYYELLLFLNDQDLPRPSVSNIPIGNFEEDDELEVTNEMEEDSQSICQDSPHCSTPIGRPASASASASAKRKRKEDQVLDLVAERLGNADRFDVFGKHVSQSIRHVSEQQQIFLMKIINDGIFAAQCGLLTQQSCIIYNNQVPAVSTEYVFELPPK